MQTIPLRILTLATASLLIGCAGDNGAKPGTGGSGGANGGSGGSVAGSGGTVAGSGGSSGSGGSVTGGSGGGSGMGGTGGASAGAGCGMGKKNPTGAIIENFMGMSQVLEWRTADVMDRVGQVVAATGGNIKVTVKAAETLALGALAQWAATDRPCMNGSNYQGIQFKMSGDVTGMLFRIGTPATYPLVDGGICMSDTLCAYAHYNKDVGKPTATPTMVQVKFSDLAPPYGMPAPFDKSALISIIFLTLDATAGHTFTISDISFF
jgi:hypothetical protein